MKTSFNKSAGDSIFFLRNGKHLRTIKELYESMDTMSDDVFMFHTEADKNDFAMWIKDVFKESALARALQSASNRQDAKKVIENWNLGKSKSMVFKPKVVREIIREVSDKEDLKKINRAKEEIQKIQEEEKKNIEQIHDATKAELEEKKNELEEELQKEVKEEIENKYQMYSKPTHFLTGILDFIIGFIIGALSMVLFLRFG